LHKSSNKEPGNIYYNILTDFSLIQSLERKPVIGNGVHATATP
jgi:hypothetical protein